MDCRLNNNQDSPILLVAHTSYAGMGPYVASIVNSFENTDNIRFFLIEKEDQYYTKSIKDELKSKSTIIQAKTPSKFDTLKYILSGFKSKYNKEIEKICLRYDVHLIHDLTGCADYKFISKISSKYNCLYTVHDLYPHEAKKSFLKKYRQRKLYEAIYKAISQSNRLITNSISQYNDLKKLYPNKTSYYAPFPSLITKAIQKGDKNIPELSREDKYILFFGRIEEYKGLSILLEAFHKVQYDVKLVIAGKGELPYRLDDKRVVFINRYIDDEEIRTLYTNSLFVVYPYISATQSGVLAVASYFKTPIIASDVAFFTEVLGSDYIGLFKNQNIQDLSEKISYFLNMSDKSINELKDKMAVLFQTNYETQSQRKQLLYIYQNIINYPN